MRRVPTVPPKAPFFVLMGDVGSGKSTLVEKLTGLTGLSSRQSITFTLDSKVFIVDQVCCIADTPGLNSMKGRIDHALNVLGAMRFKPLTCLLMVCSLKDRLDGLAQAVSDLVTPFIEEFGNNIAAIVTKNDIVPTITPEEIRTTLGELGVERVMVTNKTTTKAELVAFLQTLQGIPPIDVTIAPAQLVSYFKLAPPNLRMRAVYNKYVAHYKKLAETGTQRMNSLQGDDKRDFAFSFKAFMYDLIPQYQDQLNLELGECEGSLLFCGEMKKEFKRQLLEIRNQCKEELYLSSNSQFRKCPHCGNVWVLVEGCTGNTVCGNRPLAADVWRPFSVFEWDVNALSTPEYNWPTSPATTRTHACRFTSAQVAQYLDHISAPEKRQAMIFLNTLFTNTSQPNQDNVNQQIALLAAETKRELERMSREHISRQEEDFSRAYRILCPPKEAEIFSINQLKLCFEYTLARFFSHETAGRRPELPKPCGRTISWKNMAPVPPPPEWTKQLEHMERTVDVQDSTVDLNLHQHLSSKSTPQVAVVADPCITEAFDALKTMRKWSQSDTCVVKVRDMADAGKFLFPLPERPATPLTSVLASNPKFNDPTVKSVVANNREWNGLADDEIGLVALFASGLLSDNLHKALVYREPTADNLEIASHLLQVLNKCPAKPGKVYRGVELHQAASRYVPGKCVIQDFFCTCTRDSRIVEQYANTSGSVMGPRTLFEIDQFSGIDIQCMAAHRPQSTLLTPNTVFQVLSVERERKLDKIHLKEVHGDDLLLIMEHST
ncbi:hypothetical protein Pelo_10994 [Pelomyxa schiedti]|nr:hypothetical protein Pelo_10994 [Pelomyxa schiedti]